MSHGQGIKHAQSIEIGCKLIGNQYVVEGHGGFTGCPDISEQLSF